MTGREGAYKAAIKALRQHRMRWKQALKDYDVAETRYLQTKAFLEWLEREREVVERNVKRVGIDPSTGDWDP